MKVDGRSPTTLRVGECGRLAKLLTSVIGGFLFVAAMVDACTTSPRSTGIDRALCSDLRALVDTTTFDPTKSNAKHMAAIRDAESRLRLDERRYASIPDTDTASALETLLSDADGYRVATASIDSRPASGLRIVVAYSKVDHDMQKLSGRCPGVNLAPGAP